MSHFVTKEQLLLLRDRGITTFLLDWDGCFVEKGAWPHLRVFQMAASRLGYSFSLTEALDAYVGPKHGIDWYLLMREALLPHYHGQMPDEEFERFRRYVQELAVDAYERTNPASLELLPGAAEFLSNAKEIFGRENLIVVTATPEGIARIMMRATGVEDCLSTQVYGCERLWDALSQTAVEKSERFVWEEPAQDVGATLSQCALVEDGSAGSRFAIEAQDLGAFVSLTKNNWNARPWASFWCATTTGDWHSLKERPSKA